MSKKIVSVRINSIVGCLRAVVVREMSGDAYAAQCAMALDGEKVVEVKWLDRPGYAFVPARNVI
jgi:hypothetical protein